ncbi:MAG: hypothetical protein Q8P30_04440 [Candidatus Uhrbacteria bacterium]|nr:hypothetical protein [Candidatus Uhrbacteria bacterium]
MPKKGIELENLNEVAAFWKHYLDKLGSMPEMDVAGSMANVVSNDKWEQWYNEGKGDPLFVEAFDLLADLETPIERKLSREDMWARVKQLVKQLEEKYPE